MTEPHGTDDAQCRLLVPCIQRPFKGGTQVVLLGDYLGLLFALSCWGWMTLGEADRPIQVALADGPGSHPAPPAAPARTDAGSRASGSGSFVRRSCRLRAWTD